MTLVSCIMPTRGRQRWAQQAVDCFLAQTYPDKQLIILDDVDESSFNEPPLLNRVYYVTHASRLIPEKRNLCCELAKGEIILHWDSDDWNAPGRIADQVERLEESGKAVTGYHSILFYVEPSGPWLQYKGDPQYAVGTSLCYRKSFWELHPFQSGKEVPNIGEDDHFVKAAREADELITVDGGSMIVARTHNDNTSVRRWDALEYQPISQDQAPAILA